VLVFTRTKFGANNVAEFLTKNGIEAMALHGNKSQSARTQALAGFKSGDIRALVATDIAARGIDIDDVSHVINFELPNEPENYVHRIGRTARAGASGIAVALCDDGDERAYLRGIEKLTRMKLAQIDRPPPRPVSEASLAEPAEQRTEPRRDQRPAPSRQHAGRPNRDGRKPQPMRADAQRPVQTSEGRGNRTGTPKSGAGNGRQANASFSGLVAAIGNNGADRPAPRDDRSPRRPGGHRPGGHRRG
ncbi:MAG TPA: C-terminal helicase domain-containing protein, partial [Arenibaculum sp.]|nr:C-terminal helicase domain-containing protein [Arenibaculum sp.]